ncbi:MAG: YkgJ family cysteine cluster protein [Pirellulaceae bacterium]
MTSRIDSPRDLFQTIVSRTIGMLETSLLQRGCETDPLDLMDQLREFQSHLTDTSPQKGQRACQAGCAACCFTVAVDITPIEAIAVADYLKSYLPGQRREAIRQRLEHVVARRRKMTAEERQRIPLACGLLSMDGMCQAYAARPLICSGVFSLDREACDEAAELVQIGDIGGQVPLDQPARTATAGISGGLQRYLVEHGLDGNLYELNSAVLVALEDIDPLPRYLAGEDLFRDAICTDPHSAPRRATSAKKLHRRKGHREKSAANQRA